jgi:Flp pilus assembly pilin Flp
VKALTCPCRDTRGATAIEYSLITSLIALVIISALSPTP